MKGNVTKKELLQVLGEKEVKDLERVMKIGKKSFNDAKKLAKFMK